MPRHFLDGVAFAAVFCAFSFFVETTVQFLVIFSFQLCGNNRSLSAAAENFEIRLILNEARTKNDYEATA